MENWEFDCPQFIDFAAALDTSSHGILNSTSCNAQPASQLERKAFDSRIITPKVKRVEAFRVLPAVKISTDDEKLAALPKLSSRLSKSDGYIDSIHKSFKTPVTKTLSVIKGNRKRSLSEQCMKSKKLIPTTPNCLKRTLNSKKLKNAKTSEELEMQKITELQIMLRQRLRLNELNLKRMKMHKAPFSLEQLPKKHDRKVQIQKTGDVRGLFNQRSKPNRILAHPSLKACKFIPIFNEKEADSGRKADDSKSKIEKLGAVLKATSPFALRDLNGLHKDHKKPLKNKAPFESSNAHGGIPFLPSQEKTKPQPFSFDTSYSSSHNASLLANNVSKIYSPLPLTKPKFSENQENSFFCTYVSSTRKPKC